MSEAKDPKISDVIKMLQELKEKVGDVPIYIDYDGEYQRFNSEDFILKEDDGEKYIVIE